MRRQDSQLVVSAPGKMMITGEYAVLHGSEALVAAVDRRARAWFAAPHDAVPGPEACAAFAEASADPTARVAVDTSSMRVGDLKLGLGSSAAAAAAAAGLALADQGLDVESAAGRARVLQVALRGHRAVSPRGSGADVAASVLGGFVRFRKLGDQVETHPIDWPRGLPLRAVWMGEPANTTQFLERVDGLAQRDPTEHRARMRALGQEADRFVSAVIAADASEIIASTAAYGEAMGALGEAAGAAIVTDRLAAVAELASRVGGAAKPSGAGGGDVALAVLPDPSAEAQFVRLCEERNFAILLIDWGATGVCREPLRAREDV